MRLPRKVYFLSYKCDNSFSNKLELSLKQILHACKWHGFTTIIIPLQGQCYVMTANLDGETSLKTRHSAALTKVQHKNLGISKTSKSNFKGAMVARQVHKLVGCLECENPNPKLDSFLGRLTLWSGRCALFNKVAVLVTS